MSDRVHAAFATLSAAFILSLVIGHVACTPKQGAAAVKTAGDVGACVVLQDESGATEEQIAVACGAELVEDVTKILTAKRAVMAKKKAAMPPCASSSSTGGK